MNMQHDAMSVLNTGRRKCKCINLAQALRCAQTTAVTGVMKECVEDTFLSLMSIHLVEEK